MCVETKQEIFGGHWQVLRRENRTLLTPTQRITPQNGNVVLFHKISSTLYNSLCWVRTLLGFVFVTNSRSHVSKLVHFHINYLSYFILDYKCEQFYLLLLCFSGLYSFGRGLVPTVHHPNRFFLISLFIIHIKENEENNIFFYVLCMTQKIGVFF